MKRICRSSMALLVVLAAIQPFSTASAGALGAGINEAVQEWNRQVQEEAKAERQFEQQKRLMELQMKLQEENRSRAAEEERKLRAAEKERQAQAQVRLAEEKKRDDEEAKRRALNTGTGFAVATGGYVVTNSHVVEEKSDFAIRDYKGRFYRAQVIAKDIDRDLALLKTTGAFSPLRVISSDSVAKGQHVLAVGYPQISIQGNESKVTDGIISSFSGIQNDDKWFQISVPIQGGNSGGPLVTDAGAVVGVVVATANVARYLKLTGNLPQNVNYAIKSNVLLSFLKSNNVKTVSTSQGKSGIETVDASTVLIIAKNGPIDVNYTVSPEQVAREERERAKVAAEESARQKAAELERKKQIALDAVLEAKRQKELMIEEKKRQAEERIAQKKQQEEAKRIEQRNLAVQKGFPKWPEIRASEMFVAWLAQQPADLSQTLDSAKPTEVIAVLKRYQAERPEFAEQHFQKMGAWIADANGCKFFDPKPEPNESIIWEGKCEQARGAGKGELLWLKAGEPVQKFIGMFKDGMLIGMGRVEFIGKEYSEGPIGKGYNEGTFKNSKLVGLGKMVRTGEKGFEYEGSFKESKPEGQGKFVWKDGGSHEGYFREGKANGKGMRIYKDGSTYEGEFRDGKFGGNGKLTFPNGNISEGTFKEGNLEGQGKFIWKEGGFYEGAFKDGKFEGRGKQVFRDGGSYEGEFRNGKMDGKGILKTVDGKERFVEFADGKLVK